MVYVLAQKLILCLSHLMDFAAPVPTPLLLEPLYLTPFLLFSVPVCAILTDLIPFPYYREGAGGGSHISSKPNKSRCARENQQNNKIVVGAIESAVHSPAVAPKPS
jgi:hypothetical protein